MPRTEVLSLSVVETAKLENLETVIERGVASFVEVGRALMQIRDSLLYREKYETFEAYCQDRWSFKRTYAHYLIEAAGVVERVHNCEHPDPATESQARPLTKLPREEQAPAWKEAVETAPKGKVTAAHVEAVVNRRIEEQEPDQEESKSGTKPTTLTDVDRLIEGIEKLVAKVDAMAAVRMGHNAKSKSLVAHLKEGIKLAKAMGRSWRNE